jgi:hypothetical protein
MKAISPGVFSNAKLPVANNFVAHALRLLWQGIRLPAFLYAGPPIRLPATRASTNCHH